MNFPHKTLAVDGDGKNSDAVEALASADHEALISTIVARQSLSHSARAYIALRERACDEPAQALWMEDRIQYFADKTDKSSLAEGTKNPFVRGHFRPDMAQLPQRTYRTDANYERAVYLGNSGY